MRNLLFILIAVSVFSCKKTDEDEANEKILVGTWYTQGDNFTYSQTDSTYYIFNEDNSGMTKVLDDEDSFNWEIKKDRINTYYKEAPVYRIGQDKYNTKGMYIIKDINDTAVKVDQYFYGDTYLTLTLHKIK